MAWPSVEEQLTRDQIPAGSALERLIRDNQDFHMLQGEDADKAGVPAWLRVHYRKQHPEAQYNASDPTGGYPRTLRTIHQWMLAHPDLEPEPAPAPSPPPGTQE